MVEDQDQKKGKGERQKLAVFCLFASIALASIRRER